MENTEQRKKFRWLANETPKQIAWKGFKIFLVAYIISAIWTGTQKNILGAIPDAIIVKIAVIIQAYGSLLLFIALFKYIFLKYKRSK